MEDKIIELGIKHTTFIFGKTDDDQIVQIFTDCKSESKFARLDIDTHKTINVCRISIYIDDFNEWNPILQLFRLGKVLVNAFENVETIKIELCPDMEKEVIYQYRITGRPFYANFGFLPGFPYLCSKSKKDFYKLPFVQPDEFLELENGPKLIFPSKLICNKTINPALLQCQKDPSQNLFRLLPSTSFYSSLRPITSMTLLRQPKYKVLCGIKAPPNGIPFCHNHNYYIPVIRYANGMSNGCYFESCSESSKYLGTFYYWEPESNIYLKMGKKSFPYFYSKFECALFLQGKILDYTKSSGENANEIYRELDHYLSKVRTDLRKAFYKYYEEEAHIFEKCVSIDEWEDLFDDWEDGIEYELDADFQRIYMNREPKYLPIHLDFRSKTSGLYMDKLFYASEDELDQPIAKALLFFDYNGAIFSKMAGGTRVVTEVLDVRTRQKSLESLCWTVI